jgi:large subunit ribosomal protein L34e
MSNGGGNALLLFIYSMLDRRVTYKRRASYRTKSNKFRIVKTPGGKLAIQYVEKKTKSIGKHGIKNGRPASLRRLSYSARTVARPYGGVLSHQEVKDRITRAFMIEEIQSNKQRAAATEKKSKKSKKSTKKSSSAKK